MNQRERASVSIAAIGGVLGCLACINACETCNETSRAVATIGRWLVFVFTTGLIINTQQGLPAGVLLTAGCAAGTTFSGVLAYALYVLNLEVFFSVALADSPNAVFVIVITGIATIAGVAISANARPFLMDIFEQIMKIPDDAAAKLEKILNTLVRIGGTLVTAYWALMNLSASQS